MRIRPVRIHFLLTIANKTAAMFRTPIEVKSGCSMVALYLKLL